MRHMPAQKVNLVVTIRSKLYALTIAAFIALTSPACQMAVGHASLWFRPATSIAPRIVEKGDGTPIYMDGLEPKGDSMFLMIRIYPAGEPGQHKITDSKLRKWPDQIKEKFKDSN
jgi:hypothetical protein